MNQKMPESLGLDPERLEIAANLIQAEIEKASINKKWKGEMFDPIETMKYIIASGVNGKFLLQSMSMKDQPFTVNEAFINKQAKRLKEKMTLPGCRAIPEAGTTLRS